MEEIHFLGDLAKIAGLGVFLVVFILSRLNIPSVLGFLITGIICGPFGLKLVEDGHQIQVLAEIGLVLLLFEAGIEFSFKTLLRMKKFLLIAGGLQLLGTIAAAALVALYAGFAWQPAIFIGMLISLSSTAIVLRVLEHRGDIETAHGRSAFSILIFQDLCLVPLVLIAPFLAGKGGQLMDLATLSGKAVLFLVAAAVAAKFLVNFLLNQVAKTKKREAFVLSVMLLCLGMAAATSHFGLSMALGAFIAGLFISTSKYNHQALGEIVTFREVFNSLVFVAIGMLFDVRILIENPILIAKVLLIVIVLKTLIGAGVTMLAGHSLRVAILTGVTIAQISEFSFVLSKLGLAEGLIDAQTNQVFLAVAILTMFVTPGFVYAGSFLNKWLEKVLPAGWMDRGTEMAGVEKFHMENHAIIVGYGNAGKDLARMFQSKGVPCVGLDMDPDVVREEHDSDIPVFYGDGGRQEVLAHAGIAKARFLALTVRDPDRSAVTVALCRRLNPDLYIVARARNSNEADALTAAGVSEVIMEESVIATQMFGGVEKKLQSK